VLAKLPGASLAVFVAWVPILKTDNEPEAETVALVGDGRARHFWDAGRLLPPLFKDVLGLPGRIPAWDVYLLYAAGVTWGDRPPAPPYWQHQLGNEVGAPKLDGAAMAAAISRLRAES